MNKSNKIVSTFVGLGLLVLFFALLLGVFAIAYSYVNNGQRNFYVQHGNEIVASETKGVRLERSATHVFNCGTLTGQAVAYDVELFVNVKNIDNFDFSVEDSRKNFYTDFSGYNCAAIFNLMKYENNFFIFVPNKVTLLEIVQAKYPDKTITDVPDIVLQKENSFILTVTDGVERTKTQIYFC